MGSALSAAWQRLQGIVHQLIAQLPNALLAGLVLLGFVLFARWLRAVVRRVTSKRQKARHLGMVLGRLSQGAMVLFGIFIALAILVPTFKIGDVIQLLGIGGVAIGFAFRDVLQNFLAGILILLTEPFRIDDQIVFKGFEGTVEDIQTRATFVKTYDGRRIVIPNAELFTNSVTVNTAFRSRRIEYDVGIGYGDDVDEARRLILEALAGLDKVLDEPTPDVLAMELAESSVVLRIRWWIHPPRRTDDLDSRDAVIRAVKRTLQASGIDLPFPTRQILFHDQTEETDGDRSQQREGWPAGHDAVPRSRSIGGTLRILRTETPPTQEAANSDHRGQPDRA